MTDIANVIGWKHNHQAGMCTEEGVITEFPGGIPSQADQDTWTAEYEATQVPLLKWYRDIATSPMNRNREDHIKDVLLGIADSPEEQEIYDAKVLLRTQKP